MYWQIHYSNIAIIYYLWSTKSCIYIYILIVHIPLYCKLHFFRACIIIHIPIRHKHTIPIQPPHPPVEFPRTSHQWGTLGWHRLLQHRASRMCKSDGVACGTARPRERGAVRVRWEWCLSGWWIGEQWPNPWLFVVTWDYTTQLYGGDQKALIRIPLNSWNVIRVLNVAQSIASILESLLPKCSRYGIFTYIWPKFMVNVGKYTIHWASGLVTFTWSLWKNSCHSLTF